MNIDNKLNGYILINLYYIFLSNCAPTQLKLFIHYNRLLIYIILFRTIVFQYNPGPY